MQITNNIHNKGLARKLKNYCRNFLRSLEQFLGRGYVVPFFYLRSYYANNSAHKLLVQNLPNNVLVKCAQIH
jgi:hypothetical protein